MKPRLVRILNLQIKGVPAEFRLAGLIVLGCELDHLHRALGYQGGGSWQAFRGETVSGKRISWEKFCKADAGCTETMHRHYHECAEAVRQRLRWMRQPEAKELLRLMEKQPSALTAAERSCMIESIVKFGLRKDDTQTYLRKEFRAAQTPPVSNEDEKGGAPPPDSGSDCSDVYSWAVGAGVCPKKARVIAVIMQEVRRRKQVQERMLKAAKRAIQMSRENGEKLF